ncbi:MAG: hypothetical protein WC707_02125 [Candidatus Babeliaceae bacterium]|jgi:hypothetical protein
MNQKKDDNFLEIHYTYVPWALSGFFLIIFGIFVGGYFLGKKSAIQDIMHQMKQESFADKIYSSISTLYDTYDIDEEEKPEEEKNYTEQKGDIHD